MDTDKTPAPPAEPDTTQPDSLSTYRAKRSADRSPEPVGHVATDEGRLFVVHKHARNPAPLGPAHREWLGSTRSNMLQLIGTYTRLSTKDSFTALTRVH